MAAIGSVSARAPNGSRDLGRLVGQEVVDDCDLGATHPLAQRIHMEGAHHADAENGDPQVDCVPWLSPELELAAPLHELR